ncbi:MAG: energy-coupling factor transporter transmembrane component T family protein [Anaerolineaceae bacterium]
MPAFEYLRSIGIGYYYPGDSFLHRRDARMKVLFFSILILGVALTNSITGLLLGLFVALIGFWVARVPLSPCLRTIRSVSPFILLLVLLQLFIYRPGENSILVWHWKFISIYDGTLFFALRMLMRFLTLILVLGLMTAVVSTLEMNHGLEMLLRPLEALGIRTGMLVMVIQIMLRFLPLLALRMEEIAKSQAARGATWDVGRDGILKRIRLVLPLITPLFLNTLQQSERIADAMLCRGYGIYSKRSHYYEYHITSVDALFLLAGLGITAAVLYLPLFH